MWRKPNEAKPSSQPTQMPAAGTNRAEESPRLSASQPAYQPLSTPSASAPVPVIQPAPVAPNISKISSGLKIKGELSGDADLYIDGDIQGKIRLTNARLTIGPNGRIQADLEARQISVDGSVQGNLKASDSVHLGAPSRTIGSITAPRIGIDDGARLRGKIETVRTPQPAKASGVDTSESEELHPETIGAKSE